MHICPVVLSGGQGARLWPISRGEMPKQFSALVGEKSLLGLTIDRLTHPSLSLEKKVVIVGAEKHRFLLRDCILEQGCSGSLLLEPTGKNTAPAVAIAALHQNPEDLLLICPSDHYIEDAEYFAKSVLGSVEAAESGAVVTFGVRPTRATTAYGYIKSVPDQKDDLAGVLGVSKFVEKPSTELATQFLDDATMLWNSGILLVKAEKILSLMEQHAPDILSTCRTAMHTKKIEHQANIAFVRPNKKSFVGCRSDSIDYSVLQKCDAKHIKVMPFESSWRDLGGWEAVAELIAPDADGNRIIGNGLIQNANNTYVRADDRFVAAIGTNNLQIIETSDAVLVIKKGHGEQVREVVEYLSDRDDALVTTHRKVSRPWGWYDSIARGPRFQVKHIRVEPGAALSLQSHSHRSEHWVVVKGVAKVTKNNEMLLLQENESTYIPKGAKHRLENPGSSPLEIVEVQSGDYVGEDDIVRYDDMYGRKDDTGSI